MATPYTGSVPPPPPPADRVRWAWQRRPETDYRLDFWTSFGWTLLTCGLYGFYIQYQLVRRMRDHNLRRLEFLDAANTLAWQRAVDAGRAEELNPRFVSIAGHLEVLRRMTTDFRDPVVWIVIVILASSVGQIILYWLLDADLVKHSTAEAAVEGQLAAIFTTLGYDLTRLPPAHPKPPHQYGLRIVALLATCGLYGLWWLYDLMVEGNRHFDRDWVWEDGFVHQTLTAVGGL
jgi:hypothetical protein